MFGIGGKLALVMAVILATVLGLFAWYYNSTQETMKIQAANIAKLETAAQLQEELIKAQQENIKLQFAAIGDLQKGLSAAEQQRGELEAKFRKMDLNKMAKTQPAILEKKMNAATVRVFREIEDETKPTKTPSK